MSFVASCTTFSSRPGAIRLGAMVPIRPPVCLHKVLLRLSHGHSFKVGLRCTLDTTAEEVAPKLKTLLKSKIPSGPQEKMGPALPRSWGLGDRDAEQRPALLEGRSPPLGRALWLPHRARTRGRAVVSARTAWFILVLFVRLLRYFPFERLQTCSGRTLRAT